MTKIDLLCGHPEPESVGCKVCAAKEAVENAEIQWLKDWNPQVEADIAKARREAFEEAANELNGYCEGILASAGEGQGGGCLCDFCEVKSKIRAKAREA